MIRILHTNDFHGTLDETRFARLSELRSGTDLYFDTGDCVKAGNLAIPLKPEAVWPKLARLNCTASVIGNRESQPLEGAFRAKIAGATHPLLCGNMRRKDGSYPLQRALEFETRGLRVGVFAVMVPIVTERMATRAASNFLWDQPLPVAQQLAKELKHKCDAVFALTHIGFKQDQILAESCPEIDVIFGGHSHTVLSVPARVGRTWICQGGSHGRFAGVYEWKEGNELTGELVPL